MRSLCQDKNISRGWFWTDTQSSCQPFDPILSPKSISSLLLVLTQRLSRKCLEKRHPVVRKTRDNYYCWIWFRKFYLILVNDENLSFESPVLSHCYPTPLVPRWRPHVRHCFTSRHHLRSQFSSNSVLTRTISKQYAFTCCWLITPLLPDAGWIAHYNNMATYTRRWPRMFMTL